MDSNLHVSYSLEDKSYLGIIKRDIRHAGQEVGLSEEEIGKCHIIVSEMATNLIKYTVKGREILVKLINDDAHIGFELISIDRGPGMSDTRAMLRDSVSTSGTLGEGLGAMQRLSSVFDIYSQPGTGTIVLSRLLKRKPEAGEKKHTSFEVNGILLSKPGDSYCGDNWTWMYKNKSIYILVFDGLGHGIHAQEASTEAIELFKTSTSNSPAEIFQDIHAGLKKTRGGVGTIFQIDNQIKTYTFCGVGNISCRVISLDEIKACIPFNGIVGLNMSRVSNSHGAWSTGKTVILHSDGIKENWNLTKYPGLISHDPAVIAAILYRDFSRGRDDVSIVIGKNKR